MTFSLDAKSRDVTTLGEQLCFTYRGGKKGKEHLYLLTYLLTYLLHGAEPFLRT